VSTSEIISTVREAAWDEVSECALNGKSHCSTKLACVVPNQLIFLSAVSSISMHAFGAPMFLNYLQVGRPGLQSIGTTHERTSSEEDEMQRPQLRPGVVLAPAVTPEKMRCEQD
jgi:hypothetical protein